MQFLVLLKWFDNRHAGAIDSIFMLAQGNFKGIAGSIANTCLFTFAKAKGKKLGLAFSFVE